MHTSNNILIRAPRDRVFEVTTDLERWPQILPHYRYVKFYEKNPERSRVKMAAMRGKLPISWESDHIIDRVKIEQRFVHLKAWTKGMEVIWKYEEREDGVLVSIIHDLVFRVKPLSPLVEPIIGGQFVAPVANKTLAVFKEYLENEDQPVVTKPSA
jgi:ribosome-associated toxin RatA of RatAB toxin-antitoxin module